MITKRKIMNKLKYVIITGFLISATQLNAQVVYVNGADVVVMQGGILQVNGDLQNANSGNLDVQKVGASTGVLIIAGDFTNDATSGGDGTFQVEGDWINNSTFNSGIGNVVLDGANQGLGGSQSTSFYDLEITGTGIKTQTINQTVTNILALNDIELATETFTMFVTNASTAAITRTTGFVSSLNGGNLARNTALVSTYLFPVGSSIGTSRYRPIDIMPATVSANTYTVRMANVNATTESFDINLLDTGICFANPEFYHQINRTAGTDAIELTMYYDEATDGLWENMGYWTTAPTLWEKISNTTHTTGAPFNNVQVSNWNNFSNEPYILIVPGINTDLGPDQTACIGDTVYLDAGSGFISYLWSTSDTTQIIGVHSSGTYYVTVSDGSCSSIDSIIVTIQNYADATITPAGPYCDNEPAVNLSSVDPGGIWAGTGITNTSNGTYDPTSAGSGLHEVIYTISGLCGDSDTIDIRVWESPDITLGATDETCQGANDGSAWVEISGGTLPYSTLWENSNSTDTIYGLTPGYWTVLVSDDNSCVTGDSIMVFGSSEPCYIPHVYVPNIFSPNGDGNNDLLLVRGDGIDYMLFIIYDRWGEKVFESSSLSLGWDGLFKGNPVNPGVFVYRLNATFLDGSESILSGNITLIR